METLEDLPIESSPEYTCGHCGNAILPTASFCSQCGKKNTLKASIHQDASNDSFASLFSYYFIIAALLVIFSYPDLIETTFENFVLQDVIFTIITIGYGIYHFRELKGILTNIHLEVKPLMMMLGIVVTAAFVVNDLASFINNLFGLGEFSYMEIFIDSAHPHLYAILFICIQPALFEELAFRGFLFSNMLKVSNEQVAMIVTAIVFGFMHLSIISLIWLVPLGYLFALFRHKYNTLWYGVIGHFTYNLILILFEF